MLSPHFWVGFADIYFSEIIPSRKFTTRFEAIQKISYPFLSECPGFFFYSQGFVQK